VADLTTEERSRLVDKLKLDHRADSAVPARPRRTRLAVGAAVVAVLALGLWMTSGDAPVVELATARAAGGAAEASVLDASGYVTARRQATVSARITGKVVEVLIEEGMRVEEGAVLARLDATEARAGLELARAQLVAARSELDEIRARYEQAERDSKRQQELGRQRVASTQEMETAASERDSLRARLLNAGDRITVAARSVTVAEVQLADTEIRAPFSGVVVAKAAQPGEMISPISAGGGFTRTGIGTIVDMDSLEIEVDVNESFINRVKAGQAVDAMLNAYPDWKIPAEVIAVIPTADRSKATVKVRVALKVKDPRIVPDMGVRVAFLAPAQQGGAAAASGVLVPAAAVVARGDEHVVFVFRDGRVEQRTVTAADSGQDQQRVSDGLREGERVVVSPLESLKGGDVVRAAGAD